MLLNKQNKARSESKDLYLDIIISKWFDLDKLARHLYKTPAFTKSPIAWCFALELKNEEAGLIDSPAPGFGSPR